MSHPGFHNLDDFWNRYNQLRGGNGSDDVEGDPPRSLPELASFNADADAAAVLLGSHYHHAPTSSLSSQPAAAPSVFTRGSSVTDPTAPRSSTTTVSSDVVGAAPQPFAAWLHAAAAAGPTASGPLVLWCELAGAGCAAAFAGDDTARWTQHHLDHLGAVGPPRTSLCWWCDEQHMRFSGDDDDDDHDEGARLASFGERMAHIRDHIVLDPEVRSVENMRPDFAMVERFHAAAALDDETHAAAMHYSELPAALRFPGGLNRPVAAWDGAERVVVEERTRARRTDAGRRGTVVEVPR